METQTTQEGLEDQSPEQPGSEDESVVDAEVVEEEGGQQSFDPRPEHPLTTDAGGPAPIKSVVKLSGAKLEYVDRQFDRGDRLLIVVAAEIGPITIGDDRVHPAAALASIEYDTEGLTPMQAIDGMLDLSSRRERDRELIDTAASAIIEAMEPGVTDNVAETVRLSLYDRYDIEGFADEEPPEPVDPEFFEGEHVPPASEPEAEAHEESGDEDEELKSW